MTRYHAEIVQDVASWAGRAGDAAYIARAQAALPMVVAMVESYTRGNGFSRDTNDVANDVAAVIASVCCRVLANPEQLQQIETRGPLTSQIAGWQGFTLLERLTLDRYRVKAM